MTEETKTATGTQLLDKALDMIDLVESSGQRLTANDITQITGHPKPTVNRILAALVRRGFLAIDRRDQSFELGMRFTQLAATLRRSHHLVTQIEEQMISLSTRSGETVSLAVAEPAAARIVGRYHLGLDGIPGGPAGAKRPYHASAIGKALLSAMPERQALRHISRIDFERFTPRTLVGRDQLLSELQVIRARGYALDDEEIVAGTRCIAVPIFDRDGTVTAAISLSGPRYRMTDERLTEIATALAVIAATARERALPAAADGPETGEVSCLRSGGLFHPLAMAVSETNIRIVDAGAQALRIFSLDGALLESAELRGPFDAAALSPNGAIMLALGNWIQLLRPGLPPQNFDLTAKVIALCFAPDGEGYALTREGEVREVRTGRLLFRCEDRPNALTASSRLLCLGTAQKILLLSIDGTVVRKLDIGRRVEALAATDDHLWVANERRVMRIAVATGETDQIEIAERCTAAVAAKDDSVWLAGASLGAQLSDFGETARNSGAIYRWTLSPQGTHSRSARGVPPQQA